MILSLESCFCCYSECHFTECHGAILESTKLISFKKFPIQADGFKLSLKVLWNLWLCPTSTAVKHSTQNAKVKASNHATGTGREKYQKCYEIQLCPVVKHLTQNGKAKPLHWHRERNMKNNDKIWLGRVVVIELIILRSMVQILTPREKG